jgi:hypothetical protein
MPVWHIGQIFCADGDTAKEFAASKAAGNYNKLAFLEQWVCTFRMIARCYGVID